MVHLLFVHHDSLVVHATGQTTTTWRLSVFTNSTVTHGDVTSQLSGLLHSSGTLKSKKRVNWLA